MISIVELENIFRDCLYKKSEIIDNKPVVEPIYVSGISHDFGLNPTRLQNHTEAIIDMINQLPSEFKSGWSFLNMCIDKEGNQWTSQHSHCEQLAVLAIALDLGRYVMPKQYWNVFPGSVPYISFNIQI